ncbi:MAG: helix-turn-helix domain-containing protein [Candidatus Velthaea sp.]
MSALGEAFRTAREARGLSLSDVAEHIHIRSVYLAAIEAEDWPAIGAPVYVRGFIRTYARFLGLDAEGAVDEFSERVPADAPVLPVIAPAAHGSTVRAERGGPSVWAVAAGLVAALLVAAVGYEYYQYQSGGRTAARSATVQPSSPLVAQSQSAAPVRSPAPTLGVAKNELGIRLTERSWVRVVVDGNVAMEGIFPAGTMRSFTGKAATVRAGNAGGVMVSAGGKTIGALGGSGDVIERSFKLSGE